MSSALDELHHLRDEAKEGKKGDQGCQMVIQALLQDAVPQLCLEHKYQEDDQNATDSHCMVRRREQEEDKIKERYEE